MSVLDAALALEAVAGYDGLDPRQTREVPDRYDATSGLTEDIEGLRIGVLREGFLGATEAVTDSVQQAIEVLRETRRGRHRGLGPRAPHHRRRADGDVGRGRARGPGLRASTARSPGPTTPRTPSPRSPGPGSTTRNCSIRAVCSRLMAGEFSRRYWAGRLYAKAQNVRPALHRGVRPGAGRGRRTGHADHDHPGASVRADRTTAPPRSTSHCRARSRRARWRTPGRSTSPVTRRLAVPCEKRDGLPVSIQLVGRMFDDALLLRAAHAFSQTVPFAEWLAVDAA